MFKQIAYLFALTLVATSGLHAEKAAPNNQINQPSLEGRMGTNGLPKGWRVFMDPPEAYAATVMEPGRTGNQALKIDGAGTYGVVVTNRIALEPKTRYAASGWIRLQGKDSARAQLKLDYLDAAGKYLGATSIGTIGPGGEKWRLFSLLDRAGEHPDAKFIAVAISVNGQGTVQADDIALYSLAGEQAFPDNLLSNGHMEIAKAGVPVDWTVSSHESEPVRCKAVSDTAKDGTLSLELSGDVNWAVATSAPVAITKGEDYTLTGFGRCRGGKAGIKLSYYAGDKHLGDVPSKPISGKSWRKRKVRFASKRFPKATHIKAVAVIHGKADARFDGFVLTAGKTAK